MRPDSEFDALVDISLSLRRVAAALESGPRVIVLNADVLNDPEKMMKMIKEFLS